MSTLSTLSTLRTFTATLPALGGNYPLKAWPWGPGKWMVKSTDVDASFTITETETGFRVAWKAWLPGGGNIGCTRGRPFNTLKDACDWMAREVRLSGFLFE